MAILKRFSSIDSDLSFAEESEMVILGDDMVAEIILRLPVKSVARSMCVSKDWCATISDDYLRRRLPLQLSVVYFPDDPARGKGPRFACAAGGGGDGDRVLEDCDLGFFPFREGAVVCDACNGLLLFRSAGTTRFYVVDPVTRRWAALPRPSGDAMLSVLAFDPASSSRHYHVINFTGWRERGAAVEVFSSEAWAWAERDAEFGVPAGFLSGAMHFHDGAVYLLASADPDCVVRMDVGADELACTAIELPEPMDGDGRVAHSGGLLHYVTSDGDLLKIWVLEGQWRLKHAVKIDDLVEGGVREAGGEVRFLALHPEKEAVYMWSPWKLVEYDLTRKEITGAWEFVGKDHKGHKNRVVKTWLIPSSLYLSDCLADGHVQCSGSSMVGDGSEVGREVGASDLAGVRRRRRGRRVKEQGGGRPRQPVGGGRGRGERVVEERGDGLRDAARGPFGGGGVGGGGGDDGGDAEGQARSAAAWSSASASRARSDAASSDAATARARRRRSASTQAARWPAKISEARALAQASSRRRARS